MQLFFGCIRISQICCFEFLLFKMLEIVYCISAIFRYIVFSRVMSSHRGIQEIQFCVRIYWHSTIGVLWLQTHSMSNWYFVASPFFVDRISNIGECIMNRKCLNSILKINCAYQNVRKANIQRTVSEILSTCSFYK